VVFKPTLEEFLAILEVHAEAGRASGGLTRRFLCGGLMYAMSWINVRRVLRYMVTKPDAYYQYSTSIFLRVEGSRTSFLLDDQINAGSRTALHHTVGAIKASRWSMQKCGGDREPSSKRRGRALMMQHVQVIMSLQWTCLRHLIPARQMLRRW
jgi:hypothetical protein